MGVQHWSDLMASSCCCCGGEDFIMLVDFGVEVVGMLVVALAPFTKQPGLVLMSARWLN